MDSKTVVESYKSVLCSLSACTNIIVRVICDHAGYGCMVFQSVFFLFCPSLFEYLKILDAKSVLSFMKILFPS